MLSGQMRARPEEHGRAQGFRAESNIKGHIPKKELTHELGKWQRRSGGGAGVLQDIGPCF